MVGFDRGKVILDCSPTQAPDSHEVSHIQHQDVASGGETLESVGVAKGQEALEITVLVGPGAWGDSEALEQD